MEDTMKTRGMDHMDASEVSIRSWLKKNIDSERYRHTMGTYDVAMKLAQRYGADERKTAVAALLHDAGRTFRSTKAMRAYIRKRSETLPAHGSQGTGLIHAAASAAIARAVFGVRDKTILDAIRHHTTGAKKMSLIAKMIYIADFLDPNRKLTFTRELFRLAMHDLDEAVLKTIRVSISYVMNKRQYLAADSVEFYNSIISKRSRKR